MKIFNMFIQCRFSIKICFTVIVSLAIYGLFSSGKIVLKNIKINSDSYKVEQININWIDKQYVFTGTARDIATGDKTEFKYATSDLVKADPRLIKAILESLATK